MPDFPVSLYSSEQVLLTETDKAGRFEFSGLPHGTYDLQARFWGAKEPSMAFELKTKTSGR